MMNAKLKLPLAASVALLSLYSSAEERPSNRPNILFILSDDHTSQSWGIYGGILQDYVQAKNIRRLASEGCVMDNTFCSNSISVPSRAAILTGQYSHQNGVYTLDDALEPTQDNIAKQLRQAGYQTALIGKWHLKKIPAGFDHFNVLPDQGVYWNPKMKGPENWQDGGKGGTAYEGFSTDIITSQTIDWIDKRDADKPFLMFCHFKATHEPFDFPDRFKDLYKDVEFPAPPSLMDFGPKKSQRTFPGQPLEEMSKRWTTASNGPWWCNYPELPYSTEGLDSISARYKAYQKLIKDYLRCAAAIDDNIGRLLNYLDTAGLSQNTIVVYVSDQGYFLGEHGFFDKRLIYEESMRMPMVIRYPKEIAPGSRNTDLIQNTDFAPLLADYAGVKLPSTFIGRSFRQNLKGDTPTDWRKSIYYRYWLHQPIRPAHLGIRTNRYKLAYFYGKGLGHTGTSNTNTEPAWEFYDLKTDPSELRNQYNNPIYKNIIEELKTDLSKLKEEVGDKDNIEIL